MADAPVTSSNAKQLIQLSLQCQFDWQIDFHQRRTVRSPSQSDLFNFTEICLAENSAPVGALCLETSKATSFLLTAFLSLLSGTSVLRSQLAAGEAVPCLPCRLYNVHVRMDTCAHLCIRNPGFWYFCRKQKISPICSFWLGADSRPK